MRGSNPLQKSAAEAALLNAQAVIRTERPWLVVQARLYDTHPGVRFFECLNQGKTPAQACICYRPPCFRSNFRFAGCVTRLLDSDTVSRNKTDRP
jgi:hypothetical protein